MIETSYMSVAGLKNDGLSIIANELLNAEKENIKTIIFTCTKEFNCPLHLLKKRNRTLQFVKARAAICYLIKKHTNEPLKSIAGIFNQHHTSALLSVKNAEKFIEQNQKFAEKINLIESKLQSNETIFHADIHD
jgi:chromosomal replication initiation ATPase DnaA